MWKRVRRKGVIFDCDGTLLDTMHVWQGIEETLARKAEVVLTKDQTDLIGSLTIPEVCSYFHEELGLGKSIESVYSLIDDVMMRFYADEATARPGAVAFVAALVERGVRCTVASSSPHRYLTAGLSRCGLLDCMDGVLSVDDVGSSKRERAIYDAACDAMGTSVAQTWGVDDSLYAVEAMKRFGYRVIGMYDCDQSGSFEQLLGAADHAVRGFDELDPHLILA